MDRSVHSRRDFLKVGGLALGLGLSGVAPLGAITRKPARAVIQICLVGGPSHIDTWDPKPSAPAEVRGPYRTIRTNVPGIHLSENFPLLAQRADRFALLRSIYHQEAPIHETGLQLTQTGRLFAGGVEWPHFGAVLSRWFVLPRPLGLGSTGLHVSPTQSPGPLETSRGPKSWPYGEDSLQRNLIMARNLIGSGARVVTVNMFDTVFGKTTWECHANGGDLDTKLADYGRTLCPTLDRALATLLDDLDRDGLLDETLVVCLGEFGRTPKINANGGRDHWPSCWTGLIAGGGVRGGQVIGASDAHGAEPKDRPIHASEVVATIYQTLGIDPQSRLPELQDRPLVETEPISELF